MMNMIKSNLILWMLLELRRLEKQLLCTITLYKLRFYTDTV